MKSILLLLMGLTLIGCDNRQYDVLLSCEDGASGKYLIDAKIDKNKADLDITRLSKELRGKHKEWLAEHLWLYNQIPEIDDTIHISLPVDKVFSVYQEENRIKLDMRHDSLDGGLRVTLWHASDDDLSMADGEKIPDGEWMVGTPCNIVIDRFVPDYDNIEPKKLKEIKACAAYLESQALLDTIAPGKSAFVVYDENSDREMFVSKEQMNVLTNGIEFGHLMLQNLFNYPQDAVFACEVADKLRAYTKEHIDTEGKPIYVVENMHCNGADNPETTKIELYRRYAKVYVGNETYRLDKTKFGWDDDPSVTYDNDGVNLLIHADSKTNKIGFVFLDHRCFFNETEEDNSAQKKQTQTIDKELIDKIFEF